VAKLSVEEIAVNNIDLDVTQSNYDLGLARIISENIPVLLLASGDAGRFMDMPEMLTEGTE